MMMTHSVSDVKHVRVAENASHEDVNREFLGGGDFPRSVIEPATFSFHVQP